MKKLLCMALCVMMVLSLLAGCGGGETPTTTTKHTHSWADTWSTNETQHWKSCTGCGMQAMVGAHLDDDKDGACNDCGYVESCQHTFDEGKWMTNSEKHWHPATCKHEGIKGGEAAHTDENNDGVCDVCAYENAEHQHTYHPEWSSNETEHWHEASCGHSLVSDKAAHVDPENDGECDVCGWFDATHTHTFEEGWTSDAGYHWNAATCQHTGAVNNIAAHEDKDKNQFCDACNYAICYHADFDVDGICDICGYEDREHDHEYGEEWLSDHNGHWKAAQCHPGALSQKEDHVDKDNNGTCDVCAYVICSHVYKKSWSSNDTHHWIQLLCTCSVETRKDYGEHVDADGVNGCDVCMHGFQAEMPVEIIIDKQPVTIDPNAMITWTEVSINIPKPGRYLITSDNVEVHWYLSKDQENAPTSYASEVIFEQAGEVTVLAKYFDFDFKKKEAFEIKLTVMLVDDLVLDTSRGKAELPVNMIYKVVFVAQQVGVWTLQTSVPNVAMGLTLEEMELATSVEVSVDEVGELVELYVLVQDDTSSSNTFLFDWELVTPFQLDVNLGKNPISVPAEGDDYKVVFTAPEDGRFLLTVTNTYLSFSQWGLGGQNKPVRTESIQQLTPEMKAGETFTTWIQTVYNYPLSTNVNDTLTIINVGTLLEPNEPDADHDETPNDYDVYKEQIYTAPEDGELFLTIIGGQIGLESGWEEIVWLDMTMVDGNLVSQLQEVLAAGQEFKYFVRPVEETMQQNIRFEGEETTEVNLPLREAEVYNMLSYTATHSGMVTITVTNGTIGVVDKQGNVQWQTVDANNASKLTEAVYADQTINYIVKPVNAEEEMTQQIEFYRTVSVTKDGSRFSFTATQNSYYAIYALGGAEIGVTTNGVTQWVSGKIVNGVMAAVYEVKMEAGQTYVFQIRGRISNVQAMVKPVYYQVDMGQMFDQYADSMEAMGKDYVANMIPSKVYDLVIPDHMLKLRVKLSWNYKGVTVYVDGQEYKMGTEIYLQDVKSITARLRNNVALDVTFTLTVTYAPIKEEALTEGELALNKDMQFLVEAGGSATATFTASVGGTYILTNFTAGARIYIRDEMGQLSELVISDMNSYTFRLEADQTVEFVIFSDDGQELLVQLTLTAPRP